MVRYWVIAPHDASKADEFKRAWEYDLKNGTIAIGWRQLGDVSQLTREAYEKKFFATYKDGTQRTCNAVWRFYHEISVGDIVIARQGVKKMLAVGEVTATAFYDENMGKNRVADNPNFIRVKWDEKVVDFGKQLFNMFTIGEISEDKYKLLMNPPTNVIIEEDGLPVSDLQEFELEEHLEGYIHKNLKQLFKGELETYQDGEVSGRQFEADAAGTIDILAREPKTNSLVVIELKKGRQSYHVIGQILKYIGWVKENLAKKDENVKGLIICAGKNKELEYALKAVQNITIKQYKLDFQFID